MSPKYRAESAAVVVLFAVVAFLVACQGGGTSDTTIPAATPVDTRGFSTVCRQPTASPDIAAALNRELRADLANAPNAPSELVSVLAPLAGASWSGGALRGAGELDVATPFRVASVTKTFTAATILRLYEQAKLDLDAPVADVLRQESLAALRGGGYDVDAITIRHLLHHTSGLPDYAFLPEFQTVVIAEPRRRWTRLEQVQLAMDYGEKEGDPGQTFVYADTGYVLLGEIIERTSGMTLAAAYRALLRFESLGLTSTYMESLEPDPSGIPPRAQQFFNDMDITDWDPSLDLYGGGGLVSTTRDLARFFCALFEGEVFDRDDTIALMQEPSEAGRTRMAGMGLFEREVGGERCWGHEGFWGVRVVHCPTSGLTIARTINQTSWPPTYNPYALDEVIVVALK